ncbi:MAG: DUF2007 domain-containing protein [Parasphingopyxis sp.]|uniref:putative signal transducing protein n=1 Tax=Parasphingopyxis sp. TaxID=1920299 RepID=UPI002634E418|nr:DUF2007 domain-containing protein [uncultured Parasphingopyxis sp.]
MALVELENYAERIYADLARSHLAASGIEAHIFDGGLSSLGLGPIIPARLMVEEADVGRARDILDNPPEIADEDWKQ